MTVGWGGKSLSEELRGPWISGEDVVKGFKQRFLGEKGLFKVGLVLGGKGGSKRP